MFRSVGHGRTSKQSAAGKLGVGYIRTTKVGPIHGGISQGSLVQIGQYHAGPARVGPAQVGLYQVITT